MRRGGQSRKALRGQQAKAWLIAVKRLELAVLACHHLGTGGGLESSQDPIPTKTSAVGADNGRIRSGWERCCVRWTSRRARLPQWWQSRAMAPMKKLSSGTPTLNWVGAELSMQLEAMQVSEIISHHFPGRRNDMADGLSRPDSRGARPKGLEGLTIRVLNEAWALESLLPRPRQEPSL